ncbi:MAG: hypothetical protein ACSHXH_03310 [Marivita sp.]|uniref:hypothetical protein n=1 Tax=Marivita sp. TaxID=2003365 RepID=UPI003EF5EB4F
MSSYAPSVQDLRAVADTARSDTRPPVKGGPVLIADCTTPLAGETLLSLLWKRWDSKG